MAFFTEGGDLAGALARLRADPLRPLVLVLAATNLRGGGGGGGDGMAVGPEAAAAMGPRLREARRVRVEGSRATAWFRAHFKVRGLRATAVLASDGHFDVQEGDLDLDDLERRLEAAVRDLGHRAVLGLALARAVEAFKVQDGRRVSARHWIRGPRYAAIPGVKVIPGRAAPLLHARDAFEVSVRLLDGARVAESFGPTSTLQDVVDFVHSCRPREAAGTPIELGTTFPRRTFGPGDYASSLKELGIARNCLLVVYEDAAATVQRRRAEKMPVNVLVAWIAAFWAFVLQLIGLRSPPAQLSATPAAPAAPAEAANEPRRGAVRTMRDIRAAENDGESKPNEYFGGDSTVFEGDPADKRSSEDEDGQK